MATSDSMISTSNVWPNYSAANASGSSKGSQTLGKDQFLKILVTQLQNQDPMQPMQDKEFIAQMAQFTSVEQLMNISGQLSALNQSLGSVSGLIGKNVSWLDSSTSQQKSGTVDSIVISDGVQYALVGTEKIALKDITRIQTGDTTSSVDVGGSGGGAAL
ncbi:flagellar basal-body rod modification protein FlgD [Paenibacillus sophorae]|uniref:Flagellar basal-body rod modification protein FlgD n=1 Tax=Paenibacillus sophorae TaxID=1333845 RepID=A0A1H8GDY6_9BACL|nr:flagellar hook capping FlgD N-terminal domain-containing protein [Paenibacillus sophorae]QWU14172.1 flagellar hook capping protein [Paenibacillus sophorae]SEN41508.1 flagellar basal-body rod modification protein FlgD [Paenibacillus sophorae]